MTFAELVEAKVQYRHDFMLRNMRVLYEIMLKQIHINYLKLSVLCQPACGRQAVIYIKSAKGQKDRYTVLSYNIIELIRKYMDDYSPKNYLFEGGKPGSPYSFSSMNNILKKAAEKAGIRKRVYLHLLRHSFATHFLEDGFDSRYLQHILGHSSLKTTQRYMHLTRDSIVGVRSPFDKIKLNMPGGKDPPK